MSYDLAWFGSRVLIAVVLAAPVIAAYLLFIYEARRRD